jgi:hypothetical protein
VAQFADAEQLAIDGSNIYFTAWINASAGYVVRVPTSGGVTTTLATNQESPEAVAVGSKCVYWATSGDAGKLNGTITSAPK